jgi:hypothetical protein
MARALLGPDLAVQPALLELATVFATECHGTIAPSTAATYRNAWRKFVTWNSALSGPGTAGVADTGAIGADGRVVAMYLMKLWQESKEDGIGPSRVLMASCAIRHYVTNYGMESPTDHPLCTAVRELANRKLHATRRIKDGIDHHDIALLVAHYARPGASLLDLMHVTAIVLMYSALLRFDDMAEVCVHTDLLVVKATHLEIFVPRSKTDRYWDGTWTVAAARPGRAECPVTLVNRLLEAGGYQTTPTHQAEDVGPLLRPVMAGAFGTHRLQQLVGSYSQPIFSTSYDRFRGRCAEMCLRVGITKHITPHSMRVGGASEAAAAGCPGRLIMKQGRWKTEAVKDHYVRESLDQLLMVSRAVWENVT